MKNKKIGEKLTKKKLTSIPEFDNHVEVFYLHDKKSKLESYIAIHRLNGKLPSFGATRLLDYATKKDALRDALRLAKLMSYKSAMAGLPYGGAKAVIIKPKGKFSREKLLESYARGLNELNGKFITGTDVGLNVSDLIEMKKITKYLVGYSANPEIATAQGVTKSLDVALKHVYNKNLYSDFSFSIQGVGKVGYELLKILVAGGAKNITIADVDKNKVNQIVLEYPFIKVVNADKIHSQKVDIFCPCALSGVLNDKSIEQLKCKIIVGSANNQLSNNLVGQKLHKDKIIYCPDYLVNSGGLISVIDEYRYKKNNIKRLNKNIDKIPVSLNKILLDSYKNDLPPFMSAENFCLSTFKKNK